MGVRDSFPVLVYYGGFITVKFLWFLVPHIAPMSLSQSVIPVYCDTHLIYPKPHSPVFFSGFMWTSNTFRQKL